jgi:hypothetical protein
MDDPWKTNENKKAEILEQNRRSKNDEGMEYADYRGSRIGIILYGIVALFLIVFDRTIASAIASLSFAWVVGGTFSYYRFTKEKVYLVCTIFSAIVVVAFALLFILQ